MDGSDFKRVVYDVARQLGARVVSIHEPNVTPNFVTAELAVGERHVYLLRSHAGDWALCSEVDFSGCRLLFDDNPSITDILESHHSIRVRSKADLLGPFVKHLGISDHDIRYWRPQTVGDALFNWWD